MSVSDMSHITKLSDHLGVHWLWISDLGDNIGAHPGLVAAGKSFAHLSWVFPPLQWPKHLCGLFQVLFIRTDYISGAAFVLTPLRSTVQASSLCLTCFDVALSFMSVHFMQGVTLFCFLEENCIKALTHIHSTTRLL